MEYTTNDTWNILAAIIVGMIAFLLIVIFILYVWMPFNEERTYIKMEIQRSRGNEHKYWKRKLKHLYLSYIPFSKRYIKRK